MKGHLKDKNVKLRTYLTRFFTLMETPTNGLLGTLCLVANN